VFALSLQTAEPSTIPLKDHSPPRSSPAPMYNFICATFYTILWYSYSPDRALKRTICIGPPRILSYSSGASRYTDRTPACAAYGPPSSSLLAPRNRMHLYSLPKKNMTPSDLRLPHMTRSRWNRRRMIIHPYCMWKHSQIPCL
jgi:hypothetical protein